MAVSRRLRFEVLKRDNYSCRYCGAKAPDVALTVDHVIPVTLGGSDDPWNLVAACGPCNGGKASVAPDAPLVADSNADHIRWGKAIQMAAWYWSIDREVLDDVLAAFDQKWLVWKVGDKPIPRPLDWRASIERFYQSGIEEAALTHFLDVAMRNDRVVAGDTWAYFCGCCWKHVRKLQDDAKHYIQFIPGGANGQD